MEILTVENVKSTLRDLEKEFLAIRLEEQFSNLEECKTLLLDTLVREIGEIPIIKCKKIFSTHNYILWILFKIDDSIVYAVIFNIIWFEDRKGFKMYKKCEESNIPWNDKHQTTTLKELQHQLETKDKFQYSVSDLDSEEELPRFESVIKRVSETYKTKSKRRHKHHRRKRDYQRKKYQGKDLYRSKRHHRQPSYKRDLGLKEDYARKREQKKEFDQRKKEQHKRSQRVEDPKKYKKYQRDQDHGRRDPPKNFNRRTMKERNVTDLWRKSPKSKSSSTSSPSNSDF
jgi:hypothetical protein